MLQETPSCLENLKRKTDGQNDRCGLHTKRYFLPRKERLNNKHKLYVLSQISPGWKGSRFILGRPSRMFLCCIQKHRTPSVNHHKTLKLVSLVITATSFTELVCESCWTERTLAVAECVTELS